MGGEECAISPPPSLLTGEVAAKRTEGAQSRALCLSMTRSPTDAVAINAVLVAARQAVDVICDRWSLAIVAAALMGEMRFGGLAARTGIGGRLLAARLRALEADGVLQRDGPAWRLTAMGRAAAPIIGQMRRWESASAPLICAACGRVATARDIDLKLSGSRLRAVPVKQTARRRSTLSDGSGGVAGVGLGESLDVFGDKWGIEILLCVFFRVRRFGDIRRQIGISTNILADRLARLVALGVLTPEYRLTEKGIDLYGVMVAVQDWADRWVQGRVRSPVRLVHRGCGRVFHPG